MANNKLTDQLSRTFEIELPFANTLDEYLDQLIPVVRPWGQDLYETEDYVQRPWLEMRDDDKFTDIILHLFREGGEYLRSVNGDVEKGTWELVPATNKILLDIDGKAELYDLAFMNKEFFILKKHGAHKRKYFLMVFEPRGSRLEWRDAMELLFNTYRSNNNFYLTLAGIIVVIIAIILVLSIF